MRDSLKILRHHEVLAEAIPTGERLLDRSTLPYLAWVPAGRTLVLGNSQEPERELNVRAVLEDRVPVFKRSSGGGAVLLSPGCVCLALRFAKDPGRSIHDYFAQGASLLGAVAAEKLGLDLRLRGISDLAWVGPPDEPSQERKVAGCALYMPRDFVLYLVSILVEPDFEALERYLAHPSKEPEYRQGRTHRDFLAGLGALSGRVLKPEELADWIMQKIPAWPGLNLDWALCGEREG